MNIEQQKNFEEFGFTFKFKDEVDNLYKDSLNVIHARLILDNEPIRWNYKGVCITHSSKYNLTPIVPEIKYPIFKKTPDGTIAKIDSNGYRIFVLCPDLSKLGYINNILCDANWIHNWMDVLYDSERGLYHGQPVWLFKGDNLPRVFLYNATNTSLYTSSEVLFYNKIESLDKVEPISIKALKQMPFIWEQYKAFIKEN